MLVANSVTRLRQLATYRANVEVPLYLLVSLAVITSLWLNNETGAVLSFIPEQFFQYIFTANQVSQVLVNPFIDIGT